jgi:hypothetical protein
MAYRPVFLAFLAAAIGAAIVGVSVGFAPNRADWPALFVGVVSTAAMTGLVASGVQFLPNRHYGSVSVGAGVFVAFAVAVLLRAGESILGIGRVPAATVVVWAAAVILALILTREAGHRLPPVPRPPSR